MRNTEHEKIINMRENNDKIRRRKWRESDDKKLRRLFKNGYGISEIGLKMDRSERAVSQRVTKLSLYPPKVASKNGTAQQRKAEKNSYSEYDMPMAKTEKEWKV